MRYGHAMAVPVPGLQATAAARAALRGGRGRLRFAHADLAGYSVFEEAFTAGCEAAAAPMPLRLIPIFLALAWGLNWPAVKIALTAMPPFTLRALGLGSGGLLLLAGLARRSASRCGRRARAWPGVWMGGLLAVAVFNMSTAFAQLTTSTSRAAVLTFTMPMMSALLAWWWLGDRPTAAGRWRWAGHGRVCLPGVAGAARRWLAAASGAARTPLWRPAAAAAGGVRLGAGHGAAQALGRSPGDRIVLTAWQLLHRRGCGRGGARWPPASTLPSVWPVARVQVALLFHIVLGTAVAYWLWFRLAERRPAPRCRR
jgi:drug/metabolite transporter (DMT)-like permease